MTVVYRMLTSYLCTTYKIEKGHYVFECELTVDGLHIAELKLKSSDINQDVYQ